MQLHFRFSLEGRSVLFVEISRLRMTASSSLSTVDAPCMDVPPVMFTFVGFCVGTGEDVREAFREELLDLDLKSDINVPAAEGGGFAFGAATTSGLLLSENAFLAGAA